MIIVLISNFHYYLLYLTCPFIIGIYPCYVLYYNCVCEL